MEVTFKITALIILYLVGLMIYAFLMANIIPTYVFRIKYHLENSLGRGLKKYVYPTGRAVTYEPHPSIRKYVGRYVLFTLDGYKYLQLKVGAHVNRYSARVIMFDNKDCMIDTLDIEENLLSASMSSPLRLHPKTSYIAFSIDEVNGNKIPTLPYMSITLKGMAMYFGAVVALTLLEAIHLIATVNGVTSLSEAMGAAELQYALSFIPALVIGLISLALVLRDRLKKGVKVTLK